MILGLPTTEQEGERIAKALGDKLALLMGNHGSLVIGKTIALAFSNMYYLENAAKHQSQLSTPVCTPSQL